MEPSPSDADVLVVTEVVMGLADEARTIRVMMQFRPSHCLELDGLDHEDDKDDEDDMSPQAIHDQV